MVLIIGLIVIGILLLVLEILVLPGLIAGIIGGIFLVIAIIWMYADYGTTAGHITLVSTVITSLVVIYASLRSKAWNRFGLKDILEGRMNEVGLMELKEGDEGRTLSALRPSGMVLFGSLKVEAQTSGEMIDAGTLVVITRVLQNKVLVKKKVTPL
jgi:membrane-bound ClpP family serine protease